MEDVLPKPDTVPGNLGMTHGYRTVQ